MSYSLSYLIEECEKEKYSVCNEVRSLENEVNSIIEKGKDFILKFIEKEREKVQEYIMKNLSFSDRIKLFFYRIFHSDEKKFCKGLQEINE